MTRVQKATGYRRCMLPLVAACLVGGGAAARTPETDGQAFAEDVRALMAGPHRLAGREDGSLAASRYVEQRLRALGIEEVYIQEFPVVLPRMTECSLEVDGVVHPLHAVRPNVLQASVTPAEGLTGATLYVGEGDLKAYGTQDPRGKIVVLDFSCGENWKTAFAMGAKAVIFLEQPGAPPERPYHHVHVPANLPRFYMTAETAETLRLREASREVTLRAACRWESNRGRNVIAVLRGTAPEFEGGRTRGAEAVVLAAPLDTFSEVPELSPGARDAANVATLLYLAEVLQRDRPRRDVILAFFDGQAQNHIGARYFYGALFRRLRAVRASDMTLEQRRDMLRAEVDYIRGVADVLALADVFSAEAQAMALHGDALRLLQKILSRTSGRVMQDLSAMRIRLSKLRQELSEEGGDTPERRAEIEALQPEGPALGKVDRLTVVDLAWNSLLRFLYQPQSIDDALIEHLTDSVIGPEARDALKRNARRTLFRQQLHANRENLIQDGLRHCRLRLEELRTGLQEVETALTLDAAVGQQRNAIVMHLSVNLGDSLARWTFVHGDDTSTILEDDVDGMYSGVFKGVREIYAAMEDRATLLDMRSVSQLYATRMFAPSLFVDSGAIARIFRRYNLSLMTVLDPLARQGLPSDTLAKLDLPVMQAQARDMAPFLRRLFDHDALSQDMNLRLRVFIDEAQWSSARRLGQSVRQSDAGDPMRASTVPGATTARIPVVGAAQQAWALPVSESPPGFVREVLGRTDTDGILESPPLDHFRTWPTLAVTFDEQPAAAPIASRGLIVNATVDSSFLANNTPGAMTQVARVHSKTFVGYGYARPQAVATKAMRALSTALYRSDRHLACENENLLVLFAPRDAAATKLFNEYGMVLLNNEPTADAYQGQGVSVEAPFDFSPVSERTVKDLGALNTYRTRLLRDNQIGEESLERLLGRAEDIAEDAYAPTVDTLDQRHGMLETSAAFLRRMYGPLVGVMNDLVTAVVFLLLLSIPFAYALERLLIGTPHIYRRIGWFALMFLATFGVLYSVNPAFKLAATPIIIFLAFGIILLSTLVIFIMLRKLDTEMKKMQGRGVSAHNVDVSRISTMAAAVNMGISTMRRRPLRTILTSVTVVLLTFTILTFASFSSQWGNRRGYVGATSEAASRALVRHPLWEPLSEQVAATLRGYLAERAVVTPRVWLAPTSQEISAAAAEKRELKFLLASEDADQIVPVAAALGLDRIDVQRQEGLRECFAANARLELLDSDGVFLTEALAEELGYTDADIGQAGVRVRGIRLLYAGNLTGRFGVHTLVEGSSILPVDYEMSAGGESGAAAQAGDDGGESDAASFISYNADAVVVTGARQAAHMGGRLRALTIYPEDEDDLELLADDVAIISSLPTYVALRGGVHRLYFSQLVAASGFRDLVIPIVLGGLIIFATMLGSVADREREIYAFSSLGLAPGHVAMLFFAEASIYAVVGGMGGYLLGQVAAKLLALLSRMGWVAVPAMNFSSMNAIVTIFVVMGIVMLSTLYPALKAARSANPGIQRKWKLPNPHGDVFDIPFPFTVSEYDLTGVVAYLQEHFESFSDTSIGVFATMESRIVRQVENDMLGFTARIALAPFDLGIEQSFVILSQPSDVEGIDEIRVLIRRLSGTYGDWRRANRIFVDDLRKQFLIWRTVEPDVAMEYRESTLTRWDDLTQVIRGDILKSHGVAETDRPEHHEDKS